MKKEGDEEVASFGAKECPVQDVPRPETVTADHRPGKSVAGKFGEDEDPGTLPPSTMELFRNDQETPPVVPADPGDSSSPQGRGEEVRPGAFPSSPPDERDVVDN